MNMKKIEAMYNPETGVSRAVITINGKEFVAESTLQEEDAHLDSSFAGCEFAIQKAHIKVIKYKHKEAKRKLKELEKLYFEFSQLKSFDTEQYSQIASHMRKKIRIQDEKVKDLYNCYTFMEEHYIDFVETRLATMTKIKEIIKAAQAKREAMAKEFPND